MILRSSVQVKAADSKHMAGVGSLFIGLYRAPMVIKADSPPNDQSLTGPQPVNIKRTRPAIATKTKKKKIGTYSPDIFE